MQSDNEDAGPDSGRKWKAVYTIVERKGPGGEVKKYFLRCGIAFENRDASFNVRLDAIPVNGTLHIRDPQLFDDAKPKGGEGQRERAYSG